MTLRNANSCTTCGSELNPATGICDLCAGNCLRVDKPGPKLLEFVKSEPKPKSELEVLVDKFLEMVPSIENMVILVHDKKGNFKIIPYVEESLGVWQFIEVVKARYTEYALAQLAKPTTNPSPA